MAEVPKAVRALVLERDLNRCVWCGRPYFEALNIHHRLLRAHGTDNTPPNLVSLCGSGTTGCHGEAHANPRWAREVGLIVPSWEVPAERRVVTWRGPLLLALDGTWSHEPHAPR